MKTICSILLFILLPVTVFGQYIQGRITDHTTGKPIQNVHISIENIEEGTQSYANGKYQLKISKFLESGTKITFSHVSYNTVVLDFSEGNYEYNVSLTPKINNLEEVNIVQDSQLKPYLSYETMKPMGSRLHAFGSELLDDKIYVIGGNASFQTEGTLKTLDRLENLELSQQSLTRFLKFSYSNFNGDIFNGDLHVYDIQNDSWVREKDLFKNRAYHNIYHYQNKLFVLGGINLSINKKEENLDSTIDILDLQTGKMIVDETNPHQAVNFSSFVVDDNLLVIGGSTKMNRNGTKEYSNEVHLLKLEEGLWYKLDPMPSPKETTGVRVNNKIYLIGGFNNKALSEIESFDLNTQQWEHEGDLFYGISNPALAEHNSVIYIYHNGKFYTFDTKSNELNEYLFPVELQNAKMHISNNALYLIGGLRIDHKGIYPSSNTYRIEIDDFLTTQIRRSKVLN